MTKTRRVGGNLIVNVKGTTRYFANEIIINSNGRIDYHAPNYTYGEPNPRPVKEEVEIAFSGCWTSDYEGMRNLERDATNPSSHLGETVYFQLKVCNTIPVGTNITFQLWDKDYGGILKWFLSDDDTFDGKKVYRNAVVREVHGEHRMTVKLFLNPKWYDALVADLGSFKNGCLDFYWTWEYNNKPWTSNTNILNVYPSKTTLFIKSAYEGYGFPEIRSANGEIIVFSAGIVATEKPSKELEVVMDKIRDNIISNAKIELRDQMVKYSDKLSYSIAVKQLKKGHLVNNIGKLEYSRRIYTKPVFDNSGELYEITQAANFGYRKEGKVITTKGISQLDYFKQVGVRNTILKNAEKLNFIINCIDTVKFGMDGKMETLTTMFVPLDFLNAVLYPSIKDPIVELWDSIVYELAEKAKDRGIEGINDFLQTNGGQEERYNFGVTNVSKEIIDRLLKGEFKTLKELKLSQEKIRTITDSYDYQSKLTYSIFHYSKQSVTDGDDRTFIDTIFIN